MSRRSSDCWDHAWTSWSAASTTTRNTSSRYSVPRPTSPTSDNHRRWPTRWRKACQIHVSIFYIYIYTHITITIDIYTSTNVDTIPSSPTCLPSPLVNTFYITHLLVPVGTSQVENHSWVCHDAVSAGRLELYILVAPADYLNSVSDIRKDLFPLHRDFIQIDWSNIFINRSALL